MFKSLFSSDKDYSPYGIFLSKLLVLLGFMIFVWFAYSILAIIFAFIFAVFLVMLFSPFLNWCNKHHIPDWIGIVIIYIFMFFLLFLIFVSVIPIFVDQTVTLVHSLSSWIVGLESTFKTQGVAVFGFPPYLTKLMSGFDWQDTFTFIRSNIGAITGNIKDIAGQGVGIVFSVGGMLFSIATTFIFTFFLALERKKAKLFFYDVLPLSIKKYIEAREGNIIEALSSWLKGQIILSLSMFVLVYFGLGILHFFGVAIPNKATLALIAGLLESIPYFGPFLALLPALALASSISGVAMLVVLLLYIVMQQIEGQILVPVIMSKSLDLSPFFVLVMMAVGASVAGVFGMLFAVPVAAIIEIGVKDYLKSKKKEKPTKMAR